MNLPISVKHSRLLITTLTFMTLTTRASCLTNLTLGGLFSLGGVGADWDGSATLKAAELALMHINDNSDILPGYHLNIDVKNSKVPCRPGDGMKGFVELINEAPTKLMILGASCSVVSQPVAETSQHWNLVQMSSTSSSDALSSKDRFPYFFRTNPVQSGMNMPRIAIMKEFGWERVAAMHDANEVYATATNKFSEELSLNNITLLAKESFHTGETPTAQLQNIKDKDARIIVVSAYEDGYQRVFCEAYHLGMYGAKYVWLIDSWNSPNWWRNVSSIDCSDEQMSKVVENYVGTVFFDLRTDEKQTVSGLTASEYKEAYASFTNGEAYPGEDLAPFGYDSVWAVALALRDVAQQLASENSSVKIEDFDYDNTHYLRERFVTALADLSFEGITGPVSFDESGNRLSPLLIEQLVDGVEEEVGVYVQDQGIQWETEEKLVFTGGDIPRDGPLRITVYLGIDTTTFVLFTMFAIVGIGMTVAFLIINISYRTRRIIKLSCPNVNNIIAVGCLMCYVDVIVAGLNQNLVSESAVNYVCLAQVWILPISFSLAFGGLFAKTWRVHLIFRNKTKRTKIVDYHLFAIIGVVIVVDIIIVSVWTACDPNRLDQITLPEQSDTEADEIIVRTLDKCDSPNSPEFLWIGIIFGWKGILLMYGAFLAWETRKISMPQLNDSKYIAVAIYNVAIPSIIIAPIVTFITSSDKPTVSYILTASCIILGTTVTNCLIFIPKIIALRQEGKDGLSLNQGNSVSHNQVGPQRSVTTAGSSEDAAQRWKDREIVDLKELLKQRDAEIQKLKKLIDKKNGEQNLPPER